MRLNVYLARAGVASRRKADELIKASRVKVNGKVGQLNSEVSKNDRVELDGKLIKLQQLRYLLLNKPKYTVTTLKDTQNRPTVAEIVNIEERIVPVGRLDTNTTGALLLTNDGDLAHKLMHPSFEVDKVYEAEIEGEITEKAVRKLGEGVELEDGKTSPAKVKILSNSKIEIIIHEGKKHQVKRMLKAVGLPVKKLHRSKYGPLDLNGLGAGQWRDLTEAEVESLISS